jgi:hypothetical protein
MSERLDDDAMRQALWDRMKNAPWKCCLVGGKCLRPEACQRPVRTVPTKAERLEQIRGRKPKYGNSPYFHYSDLADAGIAFLLTELEAKGGAPGGILTIPKLAITRREDS